MKIQAWTWRLVEQSRLILPVVVVAALAAYTWWLVQSMPDTSAKKTNAPPSTLPDYVLGKARVERFDAQGRRVALLHGRMMAYHTKDDRLDVTALYLVAKNPNAQDQEAILQAWAKDGRYSGKSGDIELLGQVRVVTANTNDTNETTTIASTFTGEQLHWQSGLQMLSTSQPVMLQNRQGTVKGDRLLYNANTGITEISGHVKGALHARQP